MPCFASIQHVCETFITCITRHQEQSGTYVRKDKIPYGTTTKKILHELFHRMQVEDEFSSQAYDENYRKSKHVSMSPTHF